MAKLDNTKDFIGKLGKNEVYFWTVAILTPIILILGIISLFFNPVVSVLLSVVMILLSGPGWVLRISQKKFNKTWIPLECIAVTVIFSILLVVSISIQL